MKVIAVIPSRWASTRFPGKPLAAVYGKPLLQWVIEGVSSSRHLTSLLVATDDVRISELAQKCGVEVAMTSSELPSGTDRVWQAVKNLEGEVIVNIQGDEPLMNGECVDRLVEPFFEDSGLDMATLGQPIDDEALHSSQCAKIVLNQKNEAIYFSRFPIPYSRVPCDNDRRGCLKHIGMYAFRRPFLKYFCAQSPTLLEQLEGLEQLRALYLGARIRVIQVEQESWGVDTPEDVQKIEGIMKRTLESERV